MGDRTWAHLEIGGHLETVEEAEGLIVAMVNDGIAEDEQDAKNELRQAVEDDRFIYYEGEEVNYGQFDIIDAFMEEHPQLTCRTNHGNGGDYDCGSKTVHEGVAAYFKGDGVINRKTVRDLLDAGDLDGLRKRLDQDDAMEFVTVPPLTASPAVATWLKIFGEKAT